MACLACILAFFSHSPVTEGVLLGPHYVGTAICFIANDECGLENERP